MSFQTICDGYTQLRPQLLDGRNQTDETNCEQWPLVHIYNRCDGFWHTLNGSDEIDCYSSSLLNCSTNQHICVSHKTNELICLPIEKANNGVIDCLGAADEPTLCQNNLYENEPKTFYCYENEDSSCIDAQHICDTFGSCQYQEDERACKTPDLSSVFSFRGICTKDYESIGSDIAKILCRRFHHNFMKLRVYFTLDQNLKLIEQKTSSKHLYVKETIQSYQQRCHRGLDLQMWLDKEKNISTNVCLCPPSYYGDICQYQNQRVSLTLQFHVTTDSIKTAFIIIVSLIEDTDERLIHSSEQFIYLPMDNCERKFNIYLLYSTKPKGERKDYLIHIDIYEKKTLDYRGSTIKSLKFPFLPVHRIMFQVNIPFKFENLNKCADTRCLNGKCQKYFDDQENRIFCQCEKGWSGRFCTIPYISLCSIDSISLGQLANNRSLCICPVNKMGPRCLINDVTCQKNQTVTCFNKGECLSVDEYRTSQKKFLCICSKEFTGNQCEIPRTKLLIIFDKNITLPSVIFIHFIEVKNRWSTYSYYYF